MLANNLSGPTALILYPISQEYLTTLLCYVSAIRFQSFLAGCIFTLEILEPSHLNHQRRFASLCTCQSRISLRLFLVTHYTLQSTFDVSFVSYVLQTWPISFWSWYTFCRVQSVLHCILCNRILFRMKSIQSRPVVRSENESTRGDMELQAHTHVIVVERACA